MSEINFKLEIPKEEDLKTHIENIILNTINTPINGYSSIHGKYNTIKKILVVFLLK